MPQLVGPAVPAGRLAGRSQPDLHVDSLLLRPWVVDDAPRLVEAYGDPDIQRWHVRSMTDQEAVDCVRASNDRWSAETGAGWAVVEGRRLVGRISLGLIGLAEGQGVAGYWVVPEARGRRVATRALSAMTQWALDDLGLHRVELEHSTLNPASCRVADLAGFTVEGTKLRSGLHLDGWHDMHLHARLQVPSEPGASS